MNNSNFPFRRAWWASTPPDTSKLASLVHRHGYRYDDLAQRMAHTSARSLRRKFRGETPFTLGEIAEILLICDMAQEEAGAIIFSDDPTSPLYLPKIEEIKAAKSLFDFAAEAEEGST